jgi:hypothetical protein
VIVRKSVFNRFLRRLSRSEKFRVEDLEREEVTSQFPKNKVVPSPGMAQGSMDPQRDQDREQDEERIVSGEVTNS